MREVRKTDFNEVQTGFISPAGEFYPCQYGEHILTADALYRRFYGNGRGCEGDPEDTMVEKHGWLAIHGVTSFGNGYLFKFKGHLTAEQVRTIKGVCEDNWNEVMEISRFELEMEFER